MKSPTSTRRGGFKPLPRSCLRVGAPIISLQDVTKDYGAVRALGPATFDLEAGAWGLLGPNGAGKTTLILTLLGLLDARGTTSVLGLDPAQRPLDVRRRIGYVPEGDAFVPGYTGVGFAAFCGQLVGMKRADALGRAHEVLDYVGLGEARYRKVSEYSTGMRQRAKLAAALVHDPDLLVLDEPTNGLDPAGRKDMLNLLRDLAYDHHIPMLYASHVLRDVEHVCEKLLIMQDGQVRYQGTLKQLLAQAEGSYDVRVRGDRDLLRRALESRGASVSRVGVDSLRVRVPGAGGERVVLEAVVASGVTMRGMVAVSRDLEAGFTDMLEGKEAAV